MGIEAMSRPVAESRKFLNGLGVKSRHPGKRVEDLGGIDRLEKMTPDAIAVLMNFSKSYAEKCQANKAKKNGGGECMNEYFKNSTWVPCQKCDEIGYLADEDTGDRKPDSTDQPCDECQSSGGHYERQDTSNSR